MKEGWWRDPSGLALWNGFLEAGEELVAVLPALGGCGSVWLIVRREGELAAVLLSDRADIVEVTVTALSGRPALKQRVPWSVRWVRDTPPMVMRALGDPEIVRQHERAEFESLKRSVAVFAVFTLVAWWLVSRGA